MTFLIKDRVLETATGTGTTTLTLGGALSEHASFSGAGYANGDTFPAHIKGVAGSGQWECGIYTYNTGGTITRTTVANGSSGVGVAVNFTAGAKEIGVSLSAKMITDILAAQAALPVIAAGIYTPTLGNISNVAGTPTATAAYYSRVGNKVDVFGTVTVATSAAGLAELSISLPIPSTISDAGQVSGKGASGTGTQSGNIRGNGGGFGHFAFTALGTGSVQMWFNFSYSVQ